MAQEIVSLLKKSGVDSRGATKLKIGQVEYWNWSNVQQQHPAAAATFHSRAPFGKRLLNKLVCCGWWFVS
jgi:hypothetical protein